MLRTIQEVAALITFALLMLGTLGFSVAVVHEAFAQWNKGDTGWMVAMLYLGLVTGLLASCVGVTAGVIDIYRRRL